MYAKIADVTLERVSATGIMVSATVNFTAEYTDDMCSGVYRKIFGSLPGEMNINPISREQQTGWYFLDGEAQLAEIEDVDQLFGGDFDETEGERISKHWNGVSFTDLDWEIYENEEERDIEDEDEDNLPW